MKQRKWIAMLLAGGKGTRLNLLTNTIVKPAVPFGGKYRIIDFALSNCKNSGIDTVGILMSMSLYSEQINSKGIGDERSLEFLFYNKIGGEKMLQLN